MYIHDGHLRDLRTDDIQDNYWDKDKLQLEALIEACLSLRPKIPTIIIISAPETTQLVPHLLFYVQAWLSLRHS